MSHCYGMLLRIFKFLGLFQFFHSEKTKRSYVTLPLQISWRQQSKGFITPTSCAEEAAPRDTTGGKHLPNTINSWKRKKGPLETPDVHVWRDTLGSSYCFSPLSATTAGLCSALSLIAWGFLGCCSLPDPAAASHCCGKGFVQCWPLFSTRCWGSDSTVGENQSDQLGEEAWCWQRTSHKKVFLYKQKQRYGCEERHFVSQLLCLCVFSCCWQHIHVFSQHHFPACWMLCAKGDVPTVWKSLFLDVAWCPSSQLSQMHAIHHLL